MADADKLWVLEHCGLSPGSGSPAIDRLNSFTKRVALLPVSTPLRLMCS